MRYAIVGGTGTLGQALTRALLKFENTEIKIISRCELKQREMAKSVSSDRVSYHLGDVRDGSRLRELFALVDVVFHVAALKHIDVAEENPEECIKTNVLGTINVADAAVAAGVHYVAFSSTDKACLPINTYGMCKAVSEKMLLQRNKTQYQTRFSVFRWGNVVGSRGSFIPTMAKDVWTGQPVSITHTLMSRFWIKIEDAVTFMLENYATASRSEPMIPPMKAAPLMKVMESIGRGVGRPADIRIVGLRAGEKLHEAISQSDGHPLLASNTVTQFSADELDELLKPIIAEALG